MDKGEYLQELLMALFRDTHALERFLVSEGFPFRLSGRESLYANTRRVAGEVVGDPDRYAGFFAALAEHSPDRSQDVAAVREYYRGLWESTEEELPEDRGAPDDEFSASLRTVLDAVTLPPDESRATDEDHYPWTAAACVLGRFKPTGLQPLFRRPHTNALTALTGLVHVDFTGQWSLRDDVRSQCLSTVVERGQLEDALTANNHLEDGKRDKFALLVRNEWPNLLAELRTEELDEYGTVLGWMQPLRLVSEHARVRVQAALERRLVLEPLRTLVGGHFTGRVAELHDLDDHVHGQTDVPVLVVQGAGGAGKSTVIGKVLLELERQADGSPIPFAYLDFDRTANDPRRPAQLLQHIARQLRLLYSLDDLRRDFAYYEREHERQSDVRLDESMFEFDESGHLSASVWHLAELLGRIRTLHIWGWAGPSLVLVLDTFEEVQAKGPGAVDDVLGLVEAMLQALPDLKVIIAGRGASQLVCARLPGTRLIDLGELDAEIAYALLAGLGVDDRALRTAIVAKFGGNPLTLRLAAQAVRDADPGVLDVAGQADALTEVAASMVQGMLYSRILSHIADPEVVRVAHPGLAVRRITVGVLRHVLAEPCGLDPDRAEEIFTKLGREVSMFDREDGDTLWHRQDVRRLMLKTMLDEPGRADVVAKIHERAIAYYHQRTGLAANAEELYHLLMSDRDPRFFPPLWTPELAPLLEPALSEPLPSRARGWLERRLGRAGGDDRAEWNQQDWEAEAASRATSWLVSRQPERAVDVLAERQKRLPGSRLFPIEVDACLALRRLAPAERVLRQGIENALAGDDRRTQEQLAERAVRVYTAMNDVTRIDNAARWAALSCDILGQPDRGVDVLAFAVSVVLKHDTRVAAKLGTELTRRFTGLARPLLRTQPDLVCRVLHAAGVAEPALLHHAAAEVGEPEHQVFRSDAFVLDRLLARVSRAALTDLAAQLGVRTKSTTELAGIAVRVGRAGDVVSFVLDHTSEPVQVRRMVVEGLVSPVAPLFPEEWP